MQSLVVSYMILFNVTMYEVFILAKAFIFYVKFRKKYMNMGPNKATKNTSVCYLLYINVQTYLKDSTKHIFSVNSGAVGNGNLFQFQIKVLNTSAALTVYISGELSDWGLCFTAAAWGCLVQHRQIVTQVEHPMAFQG